MIILKEDLKYVKDEYVKDFVNKVYIIYPKSNCYDGTATIYAKDPIEANLILKQFKESDSDNTEDSYGYISNITEDHFTGEITNEEAKINKNIYYRY